MLAAAIPLNLAGWGRARASPPGRSPRPGSGAGQGATVAVLYGVLALVATCRAPSCWPDPCWPDPCRPDPAGHAPPDEGVIRG